MIYVLDASAVLRYLDGEAGSQRIAEIIAGRTEGHDQMLISAINWGEIAGVIYKIKGLPALRGSLDFLLSIGVEVVPVTAERAARSAVIKAEKKIPYADAFGVELAGDSSRHTLVTADFDVISAKDDVHIEFLPIKMKRI